MLEVIITKEELYDKCENVEQLYDGFYYPLLVEYKELKKQLEVLEQENKKQKEVIDKAIEYMKDFIFEPLLTNEDRKLIMYNDNLRNFEKILKEVE